jgi:hypothetical protein
MMESRVYIFDGEDDHYTTHNVYEVGWKYFAFTKDSSMEHIAECIAANFGVTDMEELMYEYFLDDVEWADCVKCRRETPLVSVNKADVFDTQYRCLSCGYIMDELPVIDWDNI